MRPNHILPHISFGIHNPESGFVRDFFVFAIDKAIGAGQKWMPFFEFSEKK
jgi:hypothetical protein